MLLDSFNRANEVPLTTAQWANPVGSGMQVATNQVAASTASGSESFWKQTFGPDCYGQMTVPTRPAAAQFFTMGVRYTTLTSTRSGYQLQWTRGGNCVLRRLDGGTPTTLNTAVGPTLNDNDVIQIIARGIEISVFNVTTKQRVCVAEDNTYTAAGFLAIGCSFAVGNNITRLDSFNGGPYGDIGLAGINTHIGGWGSA